MKPLARFGPTFEPTPVFSLPLTSFMSAKAPTATLLLAAASPVASLFSSARSPTATFAAALIFLNIAESPTALLLNPVSLALSAKAP